MEDVHRAGGIPAILNELEKSEGLLHLDRPTVAGTTLRESIAGVENTRSFVHWRIPIHPQAVWPSSLAISPPTDLW